MMRPWVRAIGSGVLLGVGVWLAVPASAEEAAVSTPSAPPAEAIPAPAAPAAVSAPAIPATPVKMEDVILLDEELPAGATTAGAWVWETQAASGAKSHSHPAAAGLQQHAVTFEAPITVPAQGEVVTSVWLDPANPPKGVMIKFTLATGEETGVYWEGEEEVFNPGEDEEIWYYGLLPEFGAWTPLAVAAEDLGIEASSVKGITFVTHGGRVLWDRTVVREMAEALPAPSAAAGTTY